MERCSKLSIHTSWELHKLPPDKAQIWGCPPTKALFCRVKVQWRWEKPCVGNTLLNLGCQGKVCFWQPLMEASGFWGRHGSFCNNSEKTSFSIPSDLRSQRCLPGACACPSTANYGLSLWSTLRGALDIFSSDWIFCILGIDWCVLIFSWCERLFLPAQSSRMLIFSTVPECLLQPIK